MKAGNNDATSAGGGGDVRHTLTLILSRRGRGDCTKTLGRESCATTLREGGIHPHRDPVPSRERRLRKGIRERKLCDEIEGGGITPAL